MYQILLYKSADVTGNYQLDHILIIYVPALFNNKKELRIKTIFKL